MNASDSQDDWSQPERLSGGISSTARGASLGQLVLNLEGFEGPLDVLLVLARSQKVDLAQISILALAEQYLLFINEARKKRLELAADYLVMAAWLAYLKSRLLLPEEPGEGEPTGEELAAQLAFRLQRLEAMREAGASLMGRDRVGRDVFLRGMPEGITVTRKSKYEATLYELLRAYVVDRGRREASSITIARKPVVAMEQALHRLERLVGHVPDWTTLESFLPEVFAMEPGAVPSSVLASTFVAALEFTRQGKIELQQTEPFAPINIRSKLRVADTDDDTEGNDTTP